MTDTRIHDLVAGTNNDRVVVRYDDETYNKIIMIPDNKEYPIVEGGKYPTVPDWKQYEYTVRMNDQEPIQVPKAKVVGTGHEHIFYNDYEHKEVLRCFPGYQDKVYKMKYWDDDDSVKEYDTHASLSIKELKDLKNLCIKGNLYCWDKLFLGKAGDIFYMKRQYFKRIWKPVNTIPVEGCLVTCIAEIVSYYFNIYKTPTHVDDELDKMNLKVLEEQVNSWFKKITSSMYGSKREDFEALMKQAEWKRGYIKDSAKLNTIHVVEKYGLKYGAIDNEIKDKDYKIIFRKELNTRVMENKPTIILLQKGKKMHFVVVVGIRYKGKDESGKPTHYIINDPGAKSSNEKVRYISMDTLSSEYWGRDITKIYLIDKK